MEGCLRETAKLGLFALVSSPSHRPFCIMPFLSDGRWRVFCLLLLCDTLTAHSVEGQCSSADPMEAQHPVQVLLERFQVGRGCAAREQGNKETHVIASERVTERSGNKMTVLLRPLSSSLSPLRTVHLVLSSKLPVSWVLESEQLPPSFPVSVQVSTNSSVQSHDLIVRVQTVHSLPSHLHALHRWALRHHGNLSSLMHTRHSDRVYVGLGEDPSLPAECRLQPLPLCSRTTQISDLQTQEAKGCVRPTEADAPEIHVIQLRSAGSRFCGSLQAEVIVSLVPSVETPENHKVVLILGSSAPVQWVIKARGVRGHLSVHSSSRVSPPSPPEPGLTVSTSLDSELSTLSDLLLWARGSGYTQVTSYTQADLANRFAIQLADDRTALHTWPPTRPRGLKLLDPEGTAGSKSLTVSCDGGLLSVTVDRQTLQGSSVAAVTLQDHRCQALANGSHFLLTLPVIFCGTEAVPVDSPRGVLYENRVLLWKNETQTTFAPGERNAEPPLSIQVRRLDVLFVSLSYIWFVLGSFCLLHQISCFAASDSDDDDDDDDEGGVTLPLIGRFTRGVKQGPEPLPVPRLGSGPVLHLKLFVTDSYEQTWIGPCVITADHRVFVEITAKPPLPEAVHLDKCFVSPLSDPKKTPFWTVIRSSCSSDPSLTLDEKGESDADGEKTEEKGGKLESVQKDHKGSKMSNETLSLKEEEAHSIRFSFILRPVFNDSMQFLHCSLLLCTSDPSRRESTKGAVKDACQAGIPIPPLVSKSPRPEAQCEIRNLSRPMVVTRPISALVPKVLPSAGQRTKRLSITPVTRADTDDSALGVPTGPLMGIVFAAFMIGVGLMGGLWCIYNITGGRPESYLPTQSNGRRSARDPPSPSDQSCSSV
uniref:Endoglin n=1 Tax=Nothobranchius furzeri TaxID=105023 RepID=A0A8C6NIN5_NOTFU